MLVQFPQVVIFHLAGMTSKESHMNECECRNMSIKKENYPRALKIREKVEIDELVELMKCFKVWEKENQEIQACFKRISVCMLNVTQYKT